MLKYYVYTHKLDGKVFCIGTNKKTGDPVQYCDVTPTHHSKAWNEHVGNRVDEIECQIVAYCDTIDELEDVAGTILVNELKNLTLDGGSFILE